MALKGLSVSITCLSFTHITFLSGVMKILPGFSLNNNFSSSVIGCLWIF